MGTGLGESGADPGLSAGGGPAASLPVVDAHLDLGWNALNGRDLELTAAEVRERERRTAQQCMVTLPELRRGRVTIVFGSIYVRPPHADQDVEPVYDERMAAAARRQADIYRRWEDGGLIRIIRTRAGLEEHLSAWAADSTPGLVVTIEGAEPIRDPDELPDWFELGVRSIGPAWGYSRYCGGYAGSWGRPGGYTPAGRELVAGMGELGVLLDLAHSSVEGWMEGVELGSGRVACTHTSPREVVGVHRMPDDGMRAAVSAAGGVVGLGLGAAFLNRDSWADEGAGRPRLPLATAGEVFAELARGAGWEHVGIGSDFDGGFGLEESPDELESIADLRKLSSVLPPEHAAGVMGGNWIDLLRRVLPP